MNTRTLHTPSGDIQFPAYIPVTTFGKKYPLDGLIQPYLPRLAQAVMVSHYYAKQMTRRPSLPLMIDSGGFAAIFEGSRILKKKGLGILEVNMTDAPKLLTPWDVLEFQEQHADIAFTLDFPIPESLPLKEKKRRLELTINNAHWALANRRRREMKLFACIQGWDLDSFKSCAASYANLDFDGVAIGGMVPRAKDRDFIISCVKAVREEIPDLPLHVFGLGHPEFIADLFAAGVDSIDSSAYVRAAADGKSWFDPDTPLSDPSPTDRLRLALENLTFASGRIPLRQRLQVSEFGRL
jgi:tRNA-guanine family transglycosylase